MLTVDAEALARAELRRIVFTEGINPTRASALALLAPQPPFRSEASASRRSLGARNKAAIGMARRGRKRKNGLSRS